MAGTDGLLPVTYPVRAAEVAGRRERRFALAPDAEARATVARVLGVDALAALTFEGTLRPLGRRDVTLDARLAATVRQSCVATLQPVTTAIDEAVQRVYVAGLAPPEAEETEVPADDDREPLPEVIDLGAVMIEALALALPDYPRAPGAAPADVTLAPPGTAPLDAEAMRPFAALARLRDPE